MVEDKIDEGYDSLLRLAIRNCALVLDNNDDLWKETGFIMGRIMIPKLVVKTVDLMGSRLVFASTLCGMVLIDGDFFCGNCVAIESDLQKMVV